MSETESHHNGKNEIIIIKRHGGGDHDGGGHGGAWKIAYADFMTALMAFFLVMWLVNATNEKTKASITSYFNPIKLSDEKPMQKGLKKPVDQAEGEQEKEKSKEKEKEQTNGASAASGEDLTATSGDKTNYSEADFFENPYSVLSEIAQEVGQQANVSAKGEGGASDSGPATGASGGEAYRDPFDPDFWTKQVQVSAQTKSVKTDGEEIKTAKGEVIARDKATASDDGKISDHTEVPETQDQKTAESSNQQTKSKSQKAEDQEAAKLQEKISSAISGVAGKLAEGLVVTPSEGGVLVSLSDQGGDPMFNIGSAVPRKEMVLAMEKIGKILSKEGGSVLIRGHTDARPFTKDGVNDNWKLSMDRAQSAYYMLVRGGLAETRVAQVSGFADRRLKFPKEPLNPGNRRIEILVQDKKG